jgi:Methyltransferase FkbM domain
MKIDRILKAIAGLNVKGHYGQSAEDVLVRKIFTRKKKEGTYLDLGAYHPFEYSNTAFFWLVGWHGYNVDANPATIKLFEKTRPQDVNIWTAVVSEEQYANGTREIDLLLPSKENLPKAISAGGTIIANVGEDRAFTTKVKAPAKSIGTILRENNIDFVDYLNIDLEGYDELIIKDIDFSKFRPTVITIEDDSKTIPEAMTTPITQTLLSQGYDFVGRATQTSVFRLKQA